MGKGKGLGLKGNDFYQGLPKAKGMKCGACGAAVDSDTGICKGCGHMGF